MNTIQYDQTKATQIRPGVERRLAYTPNLMMTVMDFYDGPTSMPDPLHAHPHEQITYVVEGEIVFVIGDESVHLKPGDMVTIPSEAPHSIQLLSAHVRLIDCFTPVRQDFLTTP
jgi:quercetin dioxygenase-like cupin family protein